jgi:hypothetical protein
MAINIVPTSAFSALFVSSTGIGSYDLADRRDQAFAFDWTGSGKLDHIALYRPGTGAFYIVERNGGSFNTVHQGSGIASYDLGDITDTVFALSLSGHGVSDLAAYRRGTGIFYILSRSLP